MKIVAYQLVPKPLELVPAPKTRYWMDNTNNRFAYRCLPLSISNSFGWQLLNPVGFYVSWNGGVDKANLFVHIDDEFHFAESSFGYGILTIHPGYLFKTEPGWNVLVQGPSNFPCDWMQALSGVVETDWLNFTFTMNWKLHKPGTYYIPEGFPLCQIMPIPDYSQVEIEAETKYITENEDIEKDYTEWANQRIQTIKDLETAAKEQRIVGKIDPNKPDTHWEKNYMRGIDKSGKKHDNHKTSLKFPKFKKDN